MPKENIYLKAIQYFYGVPGELDEKDHKALTTFGNNVYMSLITVIFFSFIIGLFMNKDVVTYSVFVTIIVALFRQDVLVKKLGVDKLYIQKSEVQQAQGKMFRRTLAQTGMLVVLSIIVSLALWQSGIPQESGTSASIYFQIVLPGTVAMMSVIGFISIFIANRRKIEVK
ncbi:DUF3278 domain-containing protein [Streptococcus rifensis]